MAGLSALTPIASPIDRKPARQESLLTSGARKRFAQQVDVFRDPQDLLGGEPFPAVRTGYVGKELDRRSAATVSEVFVAIALAIAVTAIDQVVPGKMRFSRRE